MIGVHFGEKFERESWEGKSRAAANRKPKRRSVREAKANRRRERRRHRNRGRR